MQKKKKNASYLPLRVFMRLQDSLVRPRKDKKAAIFSVDLFHGSPGTHNAVSRSVDELKVSSCEAPYFKLHIIKLFS